MQSIIQQRLFVLQDLAYRRFQCRLMPTVEPERVIGVRMPALRRLEREMRDSAQMQDFVRQLPHRYYEENNLHGLYISALTGYEETVEALDAFLPWVDNWATCDLLHPRAFDKRPPQLPGQIRAYLDSGRTYTVRFGVKMLMDFYLDEGFETRYLDWAAGVESEEYYVRMMVAWYFATALFKRYDAALPYLQRRRLAPWVHQKTIQKAVESCRLSPEQKAYLRTLRG